MTGWTRRQTLSGLGAVLAAGASQRPATAETTHTPGARLLFLSMNGVHSFSTDTGEVTDLLLRSTDWAGRRGVFDGIDVDAANGHIYFTDMGEMTVQDGAVYRCDLDGDNVRTIVAPGGTMTPKQLKLDLAGGHVYWSDREGMALQRCNLDGSGLSKLLVTGDPVTNLGDQARWCVGMALDPVGGHVYWSQKGGDNAGQGVICRCGMDLPAGDTAKNRTDIEILYSGLPEPIDLDLDLTTRTIYWTDRGDNTVSRGAMDGGPREILLSGMKEAIGMSLDLNRGRLAYTSLNGEIGFADLDGKAHERHQLLVRPLTGAVWHP